jgi:hypothetical protein
MPIRTGVSEDPKGDPTKLVPHQPEPGGADDVEPLLPAPEKTAAPAPKKEGQTAGDRVGIERKKRGKG